MIALVTDHPYLVGYLCFNLVFTHLLISYSLKKVGKYNGVAEEVHLQNPAYNRPDAQMWRSKKWLYYLVGFFLLLPRTILTYASIALASLFAVVAMKGHPQGQKLGVVRYWIIRSVLSVFSLTCLWGLGILYPRKTRVHSDYSRWLGEGYQREGRASIVTATHASYIDVVGLLLHYFPSFIAKDDVLKFPGIGVASQAMQCVYVSRSDRESKKRLFSQMRERQEQVLRGEGNLLLIFPEASTSNNKSIVQFKKGAFFHLLPVLPVGLKYSSPFFNPANDVLNVVPHMALMACQLVSTLELVELPVFAPNDHFI